MIIPDAEAQEAAGAALATLLTPPLLIFLEGDLGAGKTTLTRGILRGLGYEGRVVSPTYTLVESYETPRLLLAHLDLYRLVDPEELEYLGLADLLTQDAVVLVEWPERGQGFLPEPDMRIRLEYADRGRRLSCVAENAAAAALMQRWVEHCGTTFFNSNNQD